MKTQRLNHLQIAVTDLERSLAFYEGLFGMQELFRAGPDMVFLKSPDADDLFTLRRIDEPLDTTAGGLQHFGFTVSKEAHAVAVEEARALGAEIIEVGQHGDGAAYVYLKDPDGYVIEIGT
jgi:catechol 2,3-dioxygenase-like lactoylglutathione lyase family enzyme